MTANHDNQIIIKIGQEGEQLYGDNLVKIGQEGFSTVEQLYGKARWPDPKRENLLYKKWGNEAPHKSTIDCYEAAKKYGGLVLVEHE